MCSNQIAISLALNIQEEHFKDEVQLVFEGNLYFWNDKILNMPHIFV